MIIGPSGSGKGTLINLVLKDLPILKKSISHTTRQKRENENNGVDYYFISKQEYQEMLDKEDILMHYEYMPNNEFYGTSKKEVLEKLSNGEFIIDETDEESVVNMIDKKLIDKNLFSSIYIMSPSINEARKRISKRNTSHEEIEKRLQNITKRLELYENTKNYYELEIVNDNLEEAYEKLKKYIESFGIKKR